MSLNLSNFREPYRSYNSECVLIEASVDYFAGRVWKFAKTEHLENP